MCWTALPEAVQPGPPLRCRGGPSGRGPAKPVEWISALAASNDPGDLIFVRLVEGHAAEAAELLAEARYSDPSSLRLRIFEADILRVSNRLDRAVELFRQLLAETHGTPDEAAVRQHLGRSYFASGNIAAAVESFAKALDLRVAGSADAALIYASTVALQRARDVLDLAS